jgi:glycine cleavage system H protein
MAEDEVKNFMGYLWMKEEDGILTIGINESGLEDFTEIQSIDFPAEGEKVESEVACATIETDDGPLDIYSPVNGTVLEVNNQAAEDPSLILEDPYEEGWLLRIEASDDVDEDEDEDEDEDDEEEEDEELEDEEE